MAQNDRHSENLKIAILSDLEKGLISMYHCRKKTLNNRQWHASIRHTYFKKKSLPMMVYHPYLLSVVTKAASLTSSIDPLIEARLVALKLVKSFASSRLPSV